MRRRRTTTHIRPNSALNIVRAFDYARHIGRPLNTFVTISFDDGQDLILANDISKKIRSRCGAWMRDHCKRKNIPILDPVWVFVFENPNDNIHVHWLINIHEDLSEKFEANLYKWLESYQGSMKPTGIDVKELEPYNDKIIANYIIKGVKPDEAERFHLGGKACPQGLVYGQRTRVSKSLGPTAIRRTNFNAQLQRHEWIDLYPEIASKYQKPDDWDINQVVPTLTGAKSFGYLAHFHKKYDRQTHWNYMARQLQKCRAMRAEISAELGWQAIDPMSADWPLVPS